jgi:hypothetical protein
MARQPVSLSQLPADRVDWRVRKACAVRLEERMRDWRGIKAVIGDRVFYVTADGTQKPEMHEAWVEGVDEAHILARPTASSSGEVTGNGHGIRRLTEPEDFVVVKGRGFA